MREGGIKVKSVLVQNLAPTGQVKDLWLKPVDTSNKILDVIFIGVTISLDVLLDRTTLLHL